MEFRIYRIETALNFVWPVAKTFPPNKFVLATELLDSVPSAYCLYTSAIRCLRSYHCCKTTKSCSIYLVLFLKKKIFVAILTLK
jgi:hypothetical protein